MYAPVLVALSTVLSCIPYVVSEERDKCSSLSKPLALHLKSNPALKDEPNGVITARITLRVPLTAEKRIYCELF